MGPGLLPSASSIRTTPSQLEPIHPRESTPSSISIEAGRHSFTSRHYRLPLSSIHSFPAQSAPFRQPDSRLGNGTRWRPASWNAL
ncbi:MAG: hypothetical protein WDW36_004161 [Sanguina aurantia]